MSDTTSEATDLCLIVLVMCKTWLEHNAPHAAVDTEIEPGQFCRTNLVAAADGALSMLRASHGDES